MSARVLGKSWAFRDCKKHGVGMIANQWKGDYFHPTKGAVVKALTKLSGDREVYLVLQHSEVTCSRGWYVSSLVDAMSTIFSAIGSFWQVWHIPAIWKLVPKLKRLCAEYYEVRTKMKPSVTLANDETYIACLMRISFIVRLTSPKDFSYEALAKEVGEEALERMRQGEKVPRSVELLLKARHSNNFLVQCALRRRLHFEVRDALQILIAQNLSKEQMEGKIGQGYKTVCRLGRMTEYWQACRVALYHDESKDLVMKTWVIPRYWFYRIGYELGFDK